MSTDSIGQSVLRIDRFIVPASARDEFMTKVSQSRDILANMNGCLQNRILEQASSTGDIKIMTIVEWDSEKSVADARSSVAAIYKERGFNPQEIFANLGITAEIGEYRDVRCASGR
jgi:heme-degrading monooxygenase HmoA